MAPHEMAPLEAGLRLQHIVTRSASRTDAVQSLDWPFGRLDGLPPMPGVGRDGMARDGALYGRKSKPDIGVDT